MSIDRRTFTIGAASAALTTVPGPAAAQSVPAGAGRNVKCAPALLWLHQLDEAGEARALGMHGARRVSRRMGAELRLDEGFR